MAVARTRSLGSQITWSYNCLHLDRTFPTGHIPKLVAYLSMVLVPGILAWRSMLEPGPLSRTHPRHGSGIVDGPAGRKPDGETGFPAYLRPMDEPADVLMPGYQYHQKVYSQNANSFKREPTHHSKGTLLMEGVLSVKKLRALYKTRL